MAATLTHAEWNKETSGLEVAKAFAGQITQKNVLVTGVSPEGIGSTTALSIASQTPALLILASRTPSKVEKVASSIREAYPGVNVYTVPLDLSSQESVRKAAAAIAQLADRLDLVINNAAVMTLKRQLTADGIELQFGSNHIGHFLLTNLLMPQLLAAAKSNTPGSTRIVNLTSLGHRLSPVRFHDYNFDGNEIPPEEAHVPLNGAFANATVGAYNGYVAYGQAKSANLLFSVELNKLLSGKGIVSYAVHPGSIWTGLSRDLDPDGEEAMRNIAPFWKNLDQGAATTLVAALDPALNEPNGILLHDCQIIEAAEHATKPELAERLWALSESLVRKEFKL